MSLALRWNLLVISLTLVLLIGASAFVLLNGYQPFCLANNSMEPTIFENECLLLTDKAVADGAARSAKDTNASTPPRRGDLVLVNPGDRTRRFISRVIGLPGEKIQLKNDRPHINGEPIGFVRTANFAVLGYNNRIDLTPRFQESLPNGVSYTIIDGKLDSAEENFRIYEVPSGSYFVLGDNRDTAIDSRQPSVGFVPFENLVSIKALRFYSARTIFDDGSLNRFVANIRLDRMFSLAR